MILFDLDGTLWDSAKSVAESWNIVLKEFGLDIVVTEELLHSVMGKTMTEIAEIMLPDVEDKLRAEVFSRCEVFENGYVAEHGGELFPGVRETLTLLKERGVPMAIVSNCQSGYIDAFLKSMDMAQYFIDYEEWGNTLRPKGENIRLVMERNGCEKAIYVGDTIKDKEAADLAGIPFVHAAYGFGKVPGSFAALDSLTELPDIYDRFFTYYLEPSDIQA